MKKLLLATTLLWPLTAHAADMAVPIKAPAATINCSITGCAYVGVTMSESGGSFNVISTGVNGLTDNNLNLGGEVGYDMYSGNIYVGANGLFEYGIVSNGTIPGGGNSSLWGGGAWGKLGYNVASAFGISPTTATNPLTQLFATTTPYVDVGMFCRPWGCGFLSGGGAMGWLTPTTSLHVDYIHVNYNNAAVNPNVNQQSEDMVLGGLDYHFGL